MSSDTSNRKVTADEFYNIMMAAIEPELVTDIIPTLDKKYADESPQDREARRVRYEAAFKLYNAKVTEFTAELQQTRSKQRKIAMASAEAKSREEDNAQLAEMEQSFA